MIFAGDAFEPFDHAEHDDHRDDADGGEDDPSDPDGELIVEQWANPEEAVADGGSAKPEALAEAEEVFGGDLGDEAEAERADEEFGDGHKEIIDDEDVGSSLHRSSLFDWESLEVGSRRIAVDIAEDRHNDIGTSSDTHTEGNLFGSRDAFTFAGKAFEEPHDGEGEDDDEEGVDGLPDFWGETFGVDEVAGEEAHRGTVLVEREPEEYGDDEYSEHSIEALVEFLSHSLFFFTSIGDAFGSRFFSRSGEAFLGAEEDAERDEHGADGSDEAVVDAGVEDIEVVLAGVLSSGDSGRIDRDMHGGEEFDHFGHCLRSHSDTSSDALMAESREVGVVGEAILSEPPAAEERSHERSDQTTDIDKHIENLEAAVAFALSDRESLGALFGCLGLEIIVHLTDDSLEVALEKAVTEGDEEESHAGKREQPTDISSSSQDRDSQDDVARSHHQEARLDRTLIVLGTVGDDTADETQDVDTHVKNRVDERCLFFRQAEFGTEEENQNGIHDVIAEAFAHIRKSGGYKTFWMTFHD